MRVQSKSKQGLYALGRLKVGELNKTEKAYEGMLKSMIVAGDILWYRFEGLKLRLADNTFYTPDFFLMTSERQLEAHEVKGYWQDDARVKIKVAAEMYPFRFVAAKPRSKKNGGGWEYEIFD